MPDEFFCPQDLPILVVVALTTDSISATPKLSCHAAKASICTMPLTARRYVESAPTWSAVVDVERSFCWQTSFISTKITSAARLARGVYELNNVPTHNSIAISRSYGSPFLYSI